MSEESTTPKSSCASPTRVKSAVVSGDPERLATKPVSGDKIDTVGETFQKFESIRVAVENNDRDDIKNIQLDNWEKQVYTLYSLLQLFKFKALQQGLNKPTETTATEDDIKQLGDMLKSKDNNALDKLAEITNKMKIVK